MINVVGNFAEIFYEKGLLEKIGDGEADITKLGKVYYSVCTTSYGIKVMGEKHSNVEIFEFLVKYDLLKVENDIVQMTDKGVIFVFENLKFSEEAFKNAKMFVEQNEKSKLWKILE